MNQIDRTIRCYNSRYLFLWFSLVLFLQLCCTEFGRTYLRDHGAYLILRELHKWETDPAARLACENTVDPLIQDEPPEHLKDLKKVEVPDHLVEEFNKIDKALQEN